MGPSASATGSGFDLLTSEFSYKRECPSNRDERAFFVAQCRGAIVELWMGFNHLVWRNELSRKSSPLGLFFIQLGRNICPLLSRENHTDGDPVKQTLTTHN